MALTYKYPFLLTQDIAENPATREELDIFDAIINHKLASVGLEQAYSKSYHTEVLNGDFMADHTNLVIHFVVGLLPTKRGAMAALWRLVLWYTKTRVRCVGWTKTNILKKLKDTHIDQVPRMVSVLGMTEWSVICGLVGPISKPGSNFKRKEWDVFISKFARDCLVYQSTRDSIPHQVRLVHVMCMADYWKTDVLDVLFSVITSQKRLLTLASRALFTVDTYIQSRTPDPIKRAFADKIATRAFYGISPSQIPTHDWAPVQFHITSYDDETKAFPRWENSLAVEEFAASLFGLVSQVIPIVPLSKLIVDYCVVVIPDHAMT